MTAYGRRSTERGFTLMELLISMVLALTVLGAVYGVLISQWRQFGAHQETMDARETLRGAAALLTSELRHASASRGDVYAIAPQSLALSSVIGAGVICAGHATQPRYGIWREDGTFQATADDSALVYSVSTSSWNRAKITGVWTDPTAAGTPTCAWAGGPAPGAAVQLSPGDTAGVGVGSAIRTFRRVQYGLFQQSGRWWLGRKVGSAASFEIVTGPLLAPADSGLVFRYYDVVDVETGDPTKVRRVEIELRSESSGKARSSTGAVTARLDSVRVAAFLRN